MSFLDTGPLDLTYYSAHKTEYTINRTSDAINIPIVDNAKYPCIKDNFNNQMRIIGVRTLYDYLASQYYLFLFSSSCCCRYCYNYSYYLLYLALKIITLITTNIADNNNNNYKSTIIVTLFYCGFPSRWPTRSRDRAITFCD